MKDFIKSLLIGATAVSLTIVPIAVMVLLFGASSLLLAAVAISIVYIVWFIGHFIRYYWIG